MFASSRSLILPVFAMFMLAAVVPAVRGDDAKTDASGTWKWSFTGQNGQTRETSLKLTQSGEKLTGSLVTPRGNVDIQDGSIKDGQITFKVVRKGKNDQEYTSTYSGKLSGDTIEGKIETANNGQSRSHDWKAMRSKD